MYIYISKFPELSHSFLFSSYHYTQNSQLLFPSYLSRLYIPPVDSITLMIFGVANKSLNVSTQNFRHIFVNYFVVSPNILLSIVFSNVLIPRSCLLTRDQIIHPYKRIHRIIFPPYFNPCLFI